MALAPQHWLAGSELGDRFTDVRLLHAGSRFTIYEGRDTASNQQVAIKVPDEARGTWLAEVLDAEARVLAALRGHPHIVRCHGRVELRDGRPALLLERCTGRLRERLHAGVPVPLPEAVAIGIKLADALEATHRHGVLHCDVRPRNVLFNSGGEPVLAGFDAHLPIADAATRPPLHDVSPHTAPELLEGAEPTTASDVYGLASTLYELVAGRAAFREYAGESRATVIVRLLSSPVRPIFDGQVPFEISDLLTWALAPDPANRPPSPAWIAEELGRVEARQGWPRTRISPR